MKVGKYLFELKSFKFHEDMSDETNCFSAVLCVNGKRVADCSNTGHGGPTDVRFFPEQGDLGREIEAFLATQPKVKPAGYNFELELDLEYIVDDLVTTILEGKNRKWAERQTQKHLVFQYPLGYSTKGWKGRTIESMLSDPAGRKLIRQTIAEETAKGRTLVNKNIPAGLLPAKPSN